MAEKFVGVFEMIRAIDWEWEDCGAVNYWLSVVLNSKIPLSIKRQKPCK